MHFLSDNEYQDSQVPGSLVGALALWRTLLTASEHVIPQQLVFAIACPSEARARRVAAHLRRNRACAQALVKQVDGEVRKDWHVEGATRSEIQSLGNLEHLFTWLRKVARSQQVELLHLRLN